MLAHCCVAQERPRGDRRAHQTCSATAAQVPWMTRFTHIVCGPVAWAMYIGWADRRAAAADPYWAPRWGLYRQNGGTGANAVAPIALDPGITNVINELHNQLGTFCIDNQGATFPWSMDSVWRYLNPRTGTWRITHWNSFGFCEDYIRNAAALEVGQQIEQAGAKGADGDGAPPVAVF